ncbi:MAG: acyltransferase family protein [Acidimicrobiia bacterium]|nr:acyltransferase family protein [Acidimicrobiia bacterium]
MSVEQTTTASPSQPEQISQVPYLPGLDGMRAFAVVAVMIYHANSTWLNGGFLGVEVFFVISGYLITLLLIAEKERTKTVNLVQFWIRRGRRLLPALGFMLLLLSIWTALFEQDALGKLRGDVVGGLFYVSNWYQVFIGAGYAATNDFAPLRHLWSLAVEEQFYLLWPLVMIVLLRRGPRRITAAAKWLFIGSIGLTVIVAMLYHSGPIGTPEVTPEAYWDIGGRSISKADALYLSTVTRAGGLMLGAAFAMIWRPAAVMRGPLRDKARALDVASLLGLIALGYMFWSIGFIDAGGADAQLFKGGFLATSIASLAIIAAVTHPGTITSRALAGPVLLWIGTRSYGLYLYHWPIYQIIRNIAGNKLVLHEFLLAMVATAIITEFSYRYIETPIRRGALGAVWQRARAPRELRDPRDRSRRGAALIGAFVGTALAVFAGASLVTAELQQNAVEESLEEGAEVACDVVNDPNCDGVDDEPAEAGAETTAPASSDVTATTIDGVVPATTIAPTTTLTPSVIENLALGDSVMLGAAGQLAEIGYTVDAQESRQFADGVETIAALRTEGRLGDRVVVHLGTNGPFSSSSMTEMMDLLVDVPRVVLVTNDVDRDYTASNNAIIYDAVNSYDNAELLDWQGLSSECPGNCFYEDGIHLRPEGQVYYATLVGSVSGPP